MLVTAAAEVVLTSLHDARFHWDFVSLNLYEWTRLSLKLHLIDVRWRIVIAYCNIVFVIDVV